MVFCTAFVAGLEVFLTATLTAALTTFFAAGFFKAGFAVVLTAGFTSFVFVAVLTGVFADVFTGAFATFLGADLVFTLTLALVFGAAFLRIVFFVVVFILVSWAYENLDAKHSKLNRRADCSRNFSHLGYALLHAL